MERVLDGGNSVLGHRVSAETKFEASKTLFSKAFRSSKLALTKTRLLSTICPFMENAEKSTLWTDAGGDSNLRRDLKAIGPYINVKGTLVWAPQYGPMAPKFAKKSPPRLVLVNGWLFPTIELYQTRLNVIARIEEAN